MKAIKLLKKKKRQKSIEVAVSGRLKRRAARKAEVRKAKRNWFGKKIKNRSKRTIQER